MLCTRDLLVRQRTQTICGDTSPSSASSRRKVLRTWSGCRLKMPIRHSRAGSGAGRAVVRSDPTSRKIASWRDLRERAREDEQTDDEDPGNRTASAESRPSRRRAAGTAWLGLVPRQSSRAGSRSWGGYRRWVSRSAVGRWRATPVGAAWPKDVRCGAQPRMLVAVALANRSPLGVDAKNEYARRCRPPEKQEPGSVAVGNASRSEDGKGKRSTRRGRENQPAVQCLRAHRNDWTRPAYLHTGPRRVICRQ